jgi:hypothetical protein
MSPYRALASFDNEPPTTRHDFEHQFLEQGPVELGHQVRARLIPSSLQSWPARERGQRIRIHEGRRQVGDAYVEEVRL